MPTEKTSEFVINPLGRHLYRGGTQLLRLLEDQQNILNAYDLVPAERIWPERWAPHRDPLSGIFGNVALERADTNAQLVTQGTLAYVHADEVPYRVERYIPVDIYLEETDLPTLVGLRDAVRDLFETLGFEYVSYPGIAMSSTHTRGVVKTGPMTSKKLERADGLIAAGLDHLNGKNGKGKASVGQDIKAKKALLELANLQAQTRLAEQEIDRSKAETEKFNAERAAAVMAKRSKLASLLLNVVGSVAITIGTVILTFSGPSNQPKTPVVPPKVGQVITTQRVRRATHIVQLGNFFEKLAAPENGDEP